MKKLLTVNCSIFGVWEEEVYLNPNKIISIFPATYCTCNCGSAEKLTKAGVKTEILTSTGTYFTKLQIDDVVKRLR